MIKVGSTCLTGEITGYFLHFSFQAHNIYERTSSKEGDLQSVSTSS